MEINCQFFKERVTLEECLKRHLAARVDGGKCLTCAIGLGAAAKAHGSVTPATQQETTIPKTEPTVPELQSKPARISNYILGFCNGCRVDKKIFKFLGLCQTCIKKRKKSQKPVKEPPKETPEKPGPKLLITEDVSKLEEAMKSLESSFESKNLFLLPLLEKEKELMAYVIGRSKREFRSLECQILWMLKEGTPFNPANGQSHLLGKESWK